MSLINHTACSCVRLSLIDLGTSSDWCAHLMMIPSMLFLRSMSQSSPCDSLALLSSSSIRFAPCCGNGSSVLPLMCPRICGGKTHSTYSLNLILCRAGSTLDIWICKLNLPFHICRGLAKWLQSIPKIDLQGFHFHISHIPLLKWVESAMCESWKQKPCKCFSGNDCKPEAFHCNTRKTKEER